MAEDLAIHSGTRSIPPVACSVSTHLSPDSRWIVSFGKASSRSSDHSVMHCGKENDQRSRRMPPRKSPIEKRCWSS